MISGILANELQIYLQGDSRDNDVDLSISDVLSHFRDTGVYEPDVNRLEEEGNGLYR